MAEISFNGAFSSSTVTVPDVYLNILTPTGGVIRPATIGLLAMVGIASWGPVNVAKPIGDPGALNLFGSQQVRKYDLFTHAALSLQVQQQLGAGAGLLLNRVTDGSDTAASALLGLVATGTPTVTAGGTGYVTADKVTLTNGVVLTVTASGGVISSVVIFSAGATSKPANPVAVASTTGSGTGATFTLAYGQQLTLTSMYTGTAGNNASATISAGSAANSSKIVINMPNFTPEVFDNITGSGNALWVNMAAAINSGNSAQRGPSKLVVATAGALTSAPTNATSTFSGGTDGVATITSSVLVGADGAAGARTGIYAFRGMGASDGVVCDLDDHTQNATIATYCQSEGTLWGVQNAMGDTPSAAATQKASDGIDTPWLYPFLGDWTYVNDNVNGVQRLIGPATLGMALTSTKQPQDSPLNDKVPLVVATQESKSGSIYDPQTDLLTLTNAGIEVIMNPCPGGSYFGLRIGRNASSNGNINTVNWARLTSFLARSLAGPGCLGPAIGQTIVPGPGGFIDTWYAVLDNWLSGLQNAEPTPTIQAYQIQFDTTNNPQSQTGTGLVVANVLIQYLGIAQRFLVNMQTGATEVIPASTSNAAAA